MKKITLVFLVLLTCVFTAQAQFPESFETAVPPAGWASFRGTNGLGTTQDWKVDVYAATGAQAAFVRYENVTGGLAEDWLVTPQFTPTASTNVLEFLQSQDYADDYGSVYTIRVSEVSQTTHADFTIIDTQTEADLGFAYAPHYVDLSAYIGTPIYVAFVMSNDDGDNWYVDDVNLVASASAPECASNPTPANLATDVAIPGGELTLSWDAPTSGDAPSAYELFFGDTSGSLTSIASVSGTTIDLINLDFETTYYWMIVPSNSGGSATGCTEWTFTTGIAPPATANDACETATEVTSLPFSVSQDATDSTNNAGGIPDCADGMNDGVWYSFTPTSDGNVNIAITNSVGADLELAIYSGSCGVFTCVDSVDAGFSGDDETLTAVPVVSGTQYFINVGNWSLVTDNPEGTFDISITGSVTLSNGTLENETAFSYYPNPVKGTLNLKAQNNIQNVAIYNMLGQEVLRNTPNTLESNVDMASLQTGAYFVKVTINDATQTIRIIKQ